LIQNRVKQPINKQPALIIAKNFINAILIRKKRLAAKGSLPPKVYNPAAPLQPFFFAFLEHQPYLC
jgi:hypothetical protein